MLIRQMTDQDWASVAAIYRAGIETGHATFETEVPEWDEWDAAHLPALRLVAVDVTDTPLGWVAASPVSDRCVYGGVVEHGIYIDPGARGTGVGTALLGAFVAASEVAGIWTVQTGIFPENTASLALHRKGGFRVVGTRERIGRHNGVWRDVTWVERRSPSIA
jgi:phosphinothricin acetyltransferase